MSKDITVQIKVKEHSIHGYILEVEEPNSRSFGLIIPRSACTVVSLVEETEEEVKGWYIKRTLKNSKELNKWSNSLSEWLMNGDSEGYFYSVKVNAGACPYVSFGKLDGFTELFIVEEFFEKVGYTPEPKLIAKQPIGLIEGFAVYEGDTVYHISFDDLQINTSKLDRYMVIGETELASKFYLTTEAVNTRLKEEVKKKVMEMKFTVEDVKEWQFDPSLPSQFADHAIKLVKKQYSVKYL